MIVLIVTVTPTFGQLDLMNSATVGYVGGRVERAQALSPASASSDFERSIVGLTEVRSSYHGLTWGTIEPIS